MSHRAWKNVFRDNNQGMQCNHFLKKTLKLFFPDNNIDGGIAKVPIPADFVFEKSFAGFLDTLRQVTKKNK
jgi:hypothetical protein